MDREQIQEKTKITYNTLSEDELPILCSRDVFTALHETNKNYIMSFIKPANLGKHLHLHEIGVSIQFVGGNTIRCIAVSDQDDALIGLAMLVCTIKALGAKIELAPYTVLIPYLIQSKNDADGKTQGAE